MNKQRKVLITTTYNEMGIIIDTKAEEVAQQNLQPTCDQLATDTISRQAAIEKILGQPPEAHYPSWYARQIEELPPTKPVIVPCNYVKACDEATRDKLTSAVWYLDVLEELKKHGYVLVDMREAME